MLDAKAPLASPALTGTPTAPTATAGTNTAQIATTAFVTSGLVLKADDSAEVKLAGTQTITGTKVFPSFEAWKATMGSQTTADIINTEASSSTVGQSARLRMGPWNELVRSSLALYIEGLIDAAGTAGVAIRTDEGDGLPAKERVRVTRAGRWGVGTSNPLQQSSVVGSCGFQAPSSTTADQPQGRISPSWADGTHATRRGSFQDLVSDWAGERGGDIVESDGSVARHYRRLPNSAPADASIPAGFGAFWLDETNNKLMVRVRSSNGATLKSGETPLT